MRLLNVLFVVLAIWVSIGTTCAGEAIPLGQDPKVEARLHKLSQELRCLVCQNETLAESRAELANDLRKEVRRLIVEGKTDAEIMEFLVTRYGDFVRYRPPVKPTTWLLWFGPFVILAASVAALLTVLRRRAANLDRAGGATLSESDHAAAQALLGEGKERP